MVVVAALERTEMAQTDRREQANLAALAARQAPMGPNPEAVAEEVIVGPAARVQQDKLSLPSSAKKHPPFLGGNICLKITSGSARSWCTSSFRFQI